MKITLHIFQAGILDIQLKEFVEENFFKIDLDVFRGSTLTPTHIAIMSFLTTD